LPGGEDDFLTCLNLESLPKENFTRPPHRQNMGANGQLQHERRIATSGHEVRLVSHGDFDVRLHDVHHGRTLARLNVLGNPPQQPHADHAIRWYSKDLCQPGDHRNTLAQGECQHCSCTPFDSMTEGRWRCAHRLRGTDRRGDSGCQKGQNGHLRG
jgi:hypothetical protein